jgi:hypothetical protein
MVRLLYLSIAIERYKSTLSSYGDNACFAANGKGELFFVVFKSFDYICYSRELVVAHRNAHYVIRYFHLTMLPFVIYYLTVAQRISVNYVRIAIDHHQKCHRICWPVIANQVIHDHTKDFHVIYAIERLQLHRVSR